MVYSLELFIQYLLKIRIANTYHSKLLAFSLLEIKTPVAMHKYYLCNVVGLWSCDVIFWAISARRCPSYMYELIFLFTCLGGIFVVPMAA